MSRRLRVILFPVIGIEKILTPRNRLALRQRQEALTVHVRWFLQSHGLHDGWSDIDIGNNLFNNGSALNHRRALHEHGYPTGRFVGHAFVDQSVLAKHVAVVSHVDDQCVIVDPHFFELLHDGADAVIDGPQCFAVALVILFDACTGMKRKVHSVPTVSLIEQPTRSIELIVTQELARLRKVKPAVYE